MRDNDAAEQLRQELRRNIRLLQENVAVGNSLLAQIVSASTDLMLSRLSKDYRAKARRGRSKICSELD